MVQAMDLSAIKMKVMTQLFCDFFEIANLFIDVQCNHYQDYSDEDDMLNEPDQHESNQENEEELTEEDSKTLLKFD